MFGTRTKAAGAVLAVATALLVTAQSASADTVTSQGGVSGNKYRGGVSANGGVSYSVAVQVNRDPAGEITKVRGAARITKLSKVRNVQVTKVVLGTSTTAVAANSTAVNSGTGTTARSYTAWRAVAPRTCTSYRVKAYLAIRWADGALSTFTVTTPLSTVCGPTSPPHYSNCDAMHLKFPHGVGKIGAVDHTSGTPVTTFYRSNFVYSGNTGLDRDGDGIACEKA